MLEISDHLVKMSSYTDAFVGLRGGAVEGSMQFAQPAGHAQFGPPGVKEVKLVFVLTPIPRSTA